jgi:hypothetical protein
MTVTIFNADGEPVARSKNLRGILAYARRSPVKRASAYAKGDGGAFVVFIFNNGAESRVDFASFAVAKAWIASRRSWGLRIAGHCETLADYVV